MAKGSAPAGRCSSRSATAAGVSAGIDLALDLTGRMAGDEVAQAIQLVVEYDPQPPYLTGSTATAPPELVAALRASNLVVPRLSKVDS